MPMESRAAMRIPEGRIRVRPSVWLVALLTPGSYLLYLGARQSWFVGELQSGRLTNQGCYLRWAAIGAAYGVLAACAFARLAPQLRKGWILVASLTILGFMQGGGYVVSRHGMNRTFIYIDRVWWEPGSREFIVHARSPRAIAAALGQGDLQVLLSVRGYWIKNEREWGEIAIGPRDLLGSATPDVEGLAALAIVEPLRVPYEPDRSDFETLGADDVGAILTDRHGNRIGVPAGGDGAIFFIYGWDPGLGGQWPPSLERPMSEE